MGTVNPNDAGILRHLEYQNTILIAMLGKMGVNLNEVLHKTSHKHSGPPRSFTRLRLNKALEVIRALIDAARPLAETQHLWLHRLRRGSHACIPKHGRQRLRGA